MPSLLVPPRPARPGTYARGTEKVDAILKAAFDVLIEEGAAGFTLRRIAARCGMQVGNLSYHFPRKEALVQLLLDELLVYYGSLLDKAVRHRALPPEEGLAELIKIYLDDIPTRRTTHLFVELWALSNHNEMIADRVESFYRTVHGTIGDFVRALNPTLAPDEVRMVALYISASMEGTTPFLGHGKPWESKMPQFRSIAIKTLVDLAKTITPEDIRGADVPPPFMLRHK